MKIKSKMIAMVEIAIVLCSLFLVAIPAIAADQNQAMQKVSATASIITTASEDDYVLGVYGNANEDDTIDMGDVVYTKLAIFGKKPKTELCDAKYDGRINVLDVIQTKLIILGKEKELTLIDNAERIVTVKKPIERVVASAHYKVEVVRMLGAKDKLVSRPGYLSPKYFPKLSKLPSIGSWMSPDYEAILSLNPDLVIAFGWIRDGVSMIYPPEIAEKLPGIPVLGFDIRHPRFPETTENIVKLGYVLDKEDEAKHYIDDFQDKYLGFIKARIKGLSEEEKPKVYQEAYGGPYRTTTVKVCSAGGRDIFAYLNAQKTTKIDPEAVVGSNPDIIIKLMKPKTDSGYEVDDISKAKAVRDEIMSRPELAEVEAVKNGRVYIICGRFAYGIHYPIIIAYYAKWFHPDLFEDLDPQAIHQEYLELLGLDFNVYEHGVWVYPPLED